MEIQEIAELFGGNGQCKARHIVQRGNSVAITCCTERAGHAGVHVGARKRWDDYGRLVKAPPRKR